MHAFVLALLMVHPTSAEYAPGRVIAKLAPPVAAALVAKAPTGDRSLDRVLSEIEPISIRRVAASRVDGKNAHLRARFGADGVVAVRYRAETDPREVCALLQAVPGVVWAQPDYYATPLATPNDPFLDEQYAMALMQMREAWDVETGSRDVVIGISDTGCDWDHPDLAANIYVNAAEDANGNGRFDNLPFDEGGDLDGIDADGNGYVDDVIGWDFITGEYPEPGEDGAPPDPDPMDFEGHGTTTSGIAAAVTDNGLMVAGTAWHCAIMPLKILYAATQGSGGITSDILESFYYAADNGVHVLSMSWRNPDSPALHEAVQYAHAAGVFLVASAGNDNGDNWQTPSSYPEVLSVAATQWGDLKADFSNFGSWVGIAAPGVGVWSTAFDDTFTTDFAGTSASCPYVAGVAGLVLSRYPESTNTEVYYRLTGTADPIDLVNPLYRGKLGSGRVNGYRALTESPHPALRLVEVVVQDSTAGNGDGLLGPGEDAYLNFKIRNFWMPAANVIGRLSTTDPSIQVDTTAILFGSIATDSTDMAPTGVLVRVSPTAEVGYHAPFVLSLEAEGAYAETQPFSIPMAVQYFADATASWGLATTGHTHAVAMADMDGDGDVDIYRAAWSYDHALYRNDGGSLVNVLAQSGLPMTGKGQGAGWGDFDNDGDPDLVHGTLQGLALFQNDGTGRFADVSAAVGISSTAAKNFTPVWGDYDGDGWLDLFVAHQEQPCQLFHNDGGTFSEVGAQAGVASTEIAYAASFADFDRDGDLDLFVANCGAGYGGARNALYVNEGDGTFQDLALPLGLAEDALVSTGGHWGDFDNDGWVDLYVTNIGPSFNGGEPNKLYRNIRGRGFVRVTDSGVEDLRSSAAASWGDFDGDGRVDLFVANQQRNALYRNLGMTFGDATESMGVTLLGWVAVWADLDDDGDEDLYLGAGGGDRILLNVRQSSPSLRVELAGTSSSRDGLHAAVTLHGDAGSLTRIASEGCGIGQGAPRLTFALAPAGANPMLTVAWPGGALQRVPVGGPGGLVVTEARPAVDAALRALVLPLGAGPVGATVRGEVRVADNGTSPVGAVPVILTVRNENGEEVYADTQIADPAQAHSLVFPAVPVPPEGHVFTVTYRVAATGDMAPWNDELFGLVSAMVGPEGFEEPPVYWDLAGGWRWATADGAYPAASGRGMLLLEPLGTGGETAGGPPLSFECGATGELRFTAQFDLADTLWVRASRADEVVASMPLVGSQGTFTQVALPFSLGTEGAQIAFTWTYDGPGGGFFCLDEVEGVTVVAGDGPASLPLCLVVDGPWPNPSSGTLRWRLGLPAETRVRVDLYDVAGRLAMRRDLGVLAPGTHGVDLEPRGLPSGAYLARFVTAAGTSEAMLIRLR